MKVTREEYAEMTERASPPSPKLKNMLKAFAVGGLICALGQALFNLYSAAGMEEQAARTVVSATLILLSAVLTGLGWYDRIARHAGAGTVVPITGFANSIVAPAIEFKSEGLVLGMGAKMFIMAGPVLVFGVTSSVLYGLILFLARSAG